MIKGTYLFYVNGLEVYRSENVITKFGKRFFTNLIAGNVNFSRQDIAIGVGSTAATDNDTRLEFEFYRLPVLFGSTDIQTNNGITTYSIVYKTTLPQDISGNISEVGLFPSIRSSINNYDSKFISDFNDYLDWQDSTELNPLVSYDNAKIGDTLLLMSSNGTSEREYFSNIVPLDISGYSANDSIKLAYFKEDNNVSSIFINLYSSNTDYYSVEITPLSGTGYKLHQDIPLSSLFSNFSGSPDKTQINKIGISVVPTSGNSTVIGLDGLRINDEDTFDPIFGLISRSVLAEPLSKLAGRSVDIEYRIDLSF